MAKYIHWALPQWEDTWTGYAACGVRVSPENTAAVFITCPRCLVKFREQNPHAFRQSRRSLLDSSDPHDLSRRMLLH